MGVEVKNYYLIIKNKYTKLPPSGNTGISLCFVKFRIRFLAPTSITLKFNGKRYV